MEFYKKFFSNIREMDTGEGAVLCPFPHKDEKGNEYFESVPSAHINLSTSLFHCKVCGQGMSEASFLSKLQGISYRDALVLLKEMEKRGDDSFIQNRENFLNSEGAQELWLSLGLNHDMHQLLQIGYTGEGIEFPVYIYGELLDIRNYAPGRTPKVMSQRGAKNLLLPFDLWMKDDRPTLLCAGEKDMAIARQMGFNAITFTGGEQAFPKLFKASFKGKKIYIAYDNDQAGQEGAKKVASLLKECGAFPHVVTGHYEVCTNKGEDIHDYFIKYGKTTDDLRAILEHTQPFSEEDHRREEVKRIPLVSIEESTQGQFAHRLVSTRVSVVATYEETYSVPEYVELRKTHSTEKCTLPEGWSTEWALDESNAKDILLLMDSGLKQQQIDEHLKMMAGIPPKEKYIRFIIKSRVNVFKAVLTDDLESETSEGDEGKTMREMLVYSIERPIKAGHKYRAYYKPTPHPLKGQQVVGIVTRLDESDNSINRFQVNSNVIDSLKCFQVQEGETVKDKMQELYERAKGIIGVEARKDVTFTTELFFHTPLEFNFGKRKKERAYLDIMMVGDPRTGKSQAAKKLLQLYELGLITSLKTATVAGLLGGSDQTGGGWKTKLGLLPRNHKGAVIMEEFSGGGQELIGKLTEVRSSNRVRLTRVNGSIDVPAMVRMMSISNPATTNDGTSLPLRNYPNGIQVLLDLVGASEDIARYDFFLLVDEPTEYISPLEDFEQEPFPRESYLNRIRWVWSRKPEQIIIEREVEQHIVKIGQDLNNEYNSYMKLFGPEAWKKLTRIAIATAGLVCSMDETGEKLIVTKEHVDWARSFLVACYDNDLFKLKEYVQAQRRLVQVDEPTIKALQGMYNNHPIMLQQLEMSTEMSQKDLQAISGLEPKEFPKVLNQLAKFSFVQFPGGKIVPTIRFREAMNKIDRDIYLKKLGEN